MFVPINKRTLIVRKIVGRKAFLMKLMRLVIYPNEENVFIVPNHGKKGDSYMHPYLSQLMNEC